MSFSTATFSAAIVCSTLVLIALAGLFAWPFTVDDAFIVASYGRQIASGGGYSLDGSNTSDGVTGPLWLLPSLLAQSLHVSAVGLAQLVSLLCSAAAVLLVLHRVRSRQGSSLMVLAVAALCVCQGDLLIWSVGGLETGAATLALVTAAVAATTTRPRLVDHLRLGSSIAVLAWLRPELVPPAALLLVCAWTRCRQHVWAAITVAVAGVLGVLVFRSTMFGHLLPLSAVAKPTELGNGIRYVLGGATLVSGVFGVGLFARGITAGRLTDRWVGTLVIAALISVLLAGGDWMPGFRLLVPVIPLYAWVAAVGASRVRRRWLGCVLVCASCALPLTSMALQLPRARASGDDRERRGAALAGWLEAHACHVALVDVGYLVYTANLRALDLAGITDATIAALPGGHVSKRIPVSLIMKRAPDTLILRGRQLRSIEDGRLPADIEWHSRTEHDLAHSADIARHYHPVHAVRYAAGYIYYVLQRDAAQSCPTR